MEHIMSVETAESQSFTRRNPLEGVAFDGKAVVDAPSATPATVLPATDVAPLNTGAEGAPQQNVTNPVTTEVVTPVTNVVSDPVIATPETPVIATPETPVQVEKPKLTQEENIALLKEKHGLTQREKELAKREEAVRAQEAQVAFQLGDLQTIYSDKMLKHIAVSMKSGYSREDAIRGALAMEGIETNIAKPEPAIGTDEYFLSADAEDRGLVAGTAEYANYQLKQLEAQLSAKAVKRADERFNELEQRLRDRDAQVQQTTQYAQQEVIRKEQTLRENQTSILEDLRDKIVARTGVDFVKLTGQAQDEVYGQIRIAALEMPNGFDLGDRDWLSDNLLTPQMLREVANAVTLDKSVIEKVQGQQQPQVGGAVPNLVNQTVPRPGIIPGGASDSSGGAHAAINPRPDRQLSVPELRRQAMNAYKFG